MPLKWSSAGPKLEGELHDTSFEVLHSKSLSRDHLLADNKVAEQACMFLKPPALYLCM